MKPWMLLLAAFLFPLNAAAQTNLEKAVSALKRERATGSDGQMMYTIAGAGRGFLAANTKLQLRKQPQLYCPPNFPLNGSNYADIAIQQYERDKSMGVNASPFAQEYPFDALVAALLDGLQRTFPCK